MITMRLPIRWVFSLATCFVVSFVTVGECQDTKKNNVKFVLHQLRGLAEANAKKPAADQLRGDRLAEHYIRGMARSCVEEQIPAKDFLIALGIGLDSSGFLRRHILTKATFQAFDDDQELELRKKSLGTPTLRDRGDWLQHFAVSASLAAAFNPDVAESLGIAKEVQDANGGSGFSFADLAADDAGIALAVNVLQHPKRLGNVAASFSVADFMPATADLEEGLKLPELNRKFGEIGSERFKAACRDIKARAFDLPVYRTWSAGQGASPK